MTLAPSGGELDGGDQVQIPEIFTQPRYELSEAVQTEVLHMVDYIVARIDQANSDFETLDDSKQSDPHSTAGSLGFKNPNAPTDANVFQARVSLFDNVIEGAVDGPDDKPYQSGDPQDLQSSILQLIAVEMQTRLQENATADISPAIVNVAIIDQIITRVSRESKIVAASLMAAGINEATIVTMAERFLGNRDLQKDLGFVMGHILLIETDFLDLLFPDE